MTGILVYADQALFSPFRTLRSSHAAVSGESIALGLSLNPWLNSERVLDTWVEQLPSIEVSLRGYTHEKLVVYERVYLQV